MLPHGAPDRDGVIRDMHRPSKKLTQTERRAADLKRMSMSEFNCHDHVGLGVLKIRSPTGGAID